MNWLQECEYEYLDPKRFPRDDVGNVLDGESGEVAYAYDDEDGVFYDVVDGELVDELEVDEEGRLFRWVVPGSDSDEVRALPCAWKQACPTVFAPFVSGQSFCLRGSMWRTVSKGWQQSG